MLFPLAESALPEGFLREWQRHQASMKIQEVPENCPQPQDHKLNGLLKFLQF